MTENRWSGGIDVGVGNVVLWGTMADIHAKGKITRAGPIELDDGLELVAVRAHFVGATRPGVVSVNGSVQSWCEPHELTGYGPTYDAAGLEVEPGDKVGLILYLPAKRAGTFMSRGWRVEFQGAFGQRVYERSDAGDFEVRVGSGCRSTNRPQSVWTGGRDHSGRHCFMSSERAGVALPTCRPARSLEPD